MIKNIIIYIILLLSAFVFNIFYYAWFSWFLLVAIICIPLLSLVISLPFMVNSATKGFSVFSEKSVYKNSEFYIGIISKKRKSFFCPLVKINLKAVNSFAGKRKKIKFKYSGTVNKPVYLKADSLSSNCGCIYISAKYCKIYDLTGIFFIPVQINCFTQIYVMPKAEKPVVIPNSENMSVIGHNAKPGGGFSDIYELRPYQIGDSLKNIHWKLSSKQDELIVREPNMPIYKQFIIKICIDENADQNDKILSKFIYICRYLNENNIVCYAEIEGRNSIFEIKEENDITMFLISLFKNTLSSGCVINQENTIVYSIYPDREEVDGI